MEVLYENVCEELKLTSQELTESKDKIIEISNFSLSEINRWQQFLEKMDIKPLKWWIITLIFFYRQLIIG